MNTYMTAAAGAAVGAMASMAWLAWSHRKANDGLPARGTPQPALTADAATLRRLLQVIELEILPKTDEQVALGNKVFGAAVLEQGSLQTVVAETNHELLNPLYHGEVYAIEQWAKLTVKLPPSGSVFWPRTSPAACASRPSSGLASRSAIISTLVSSLEFYLVYQCFGSLNSLCCWWIDETTRDQGIPHDLRIMHELWKVERFVGAWLPVWVASVVARERPP
jgi:hypothetical protein